MVGRENDHRVVEQAAALQVVKQAADLFVKHGHRGVVGPDAFALVGFADLHAWLVPQRPRRQGRGVGWRGLDHECRRIMCIETGFGRVPRHVRCVEADGREERLAGIPLPLQKLDRTVCPRMVEQRLCRGRHTDEGELLPFQPQILVPLRVRPQRHGGLHGGDADVPCRGVHILLRVVDLADRKRLVAVLAEPAAERHRVGMLAEVVGRNSSAEHE